MAWHVFAAAITGSSHVEIGLPCQDAFAHRCVGDVLCAVVCDGAGTAVSSDRGARLFADTMVEHLAQGFADAALLAQPIDVLQPMIETALEAARGALVKLAEDERSALSDYAATLVGALACGERGVLFHIGDGVGVGRPRDPQQPDVVSQPENGEYANETYFVTGEEWREHLRLLRLHEPLHAVALMSDGAAPFVMSRNNEGLFQPFVEPVDKFLATASPEVGQQALAHTLADPRTHAITSDDKTLLIAQWR